MMLSSAYILLVGARIETCGTEHLAFLFALRPLLLCPYPYLNVILLLIFCQQRENNKTARKLFSMAGPHPYRINYCRLCSYVFTGDLTDTGDFGVGSNYRYGLTPPGFAVVLSLMLLFLQHLYAVIPPLLKG